MPRLSDWDRRLARVTEKHMRLSGAWGASDCLMTVGDAIEAVTGENPFAAYRGRYTTQAGAARVMRREGCNDVEDVLARLFQPVGRLLAQRGDVGTVMQGDALTAGYVTEYGFAAKGPDGLVMHPQTAIVSAYRVE